MAARFNTRFALILAVVVVAAVAVVGGLAVLRMRADAERHIKAGDALMQSGDYRDALGAYGRAVSKKPGNPDYLNKMQAALVKIEPKNRADTENLMRTFEGIQDRRASLDPGKGANYLPLLEYWRAYAEEGDVGAAWDRLRAQADRMVTALEDRGSTSDPDYLRGRLERGVAVIRKSFAKFGAVLPTAVERDQAVRDRKTNEPGDLEVAAKQYPDEAYSLLAWQAFDEAERLRLAGRTQEATVQRDQGEVYLKAGLEATEGKGPRLRTLAARRLLQSERAMPGANLSPEAEAELSADLNAAVLALLDALRPVEDRWVLLEAEPVVLTATRRGSPPASAKSAMTAVLEEMASIYRKYLDRHPDDLVVRVELADVLVRENKYDEAITEAQTVIDSKPLPFGIDALLQRDRQVAACSVQIEALVAQWDDALAAGNKDAVADRIKDAKRVYDTMKLLSDNREDEPLLLLAQGNVLFMEDKLQSASEKFEAYVAQVPTGRLAPVLILDRAFITAAATKNWEVAKQRYKQLGMADPSGETSRRRALAAAVVYLKDKKWGEAEALARMYVEQVDANSVEAKQVLAEARTHMPQGGNSAEEGESAEVKSTMAT
ncbi:MAG: hypothetical protein KDA22_02895, partial [Phycisphaerales bacterium]|nr:hypothetical protein [Phycisphaerales bacterium]